MISEHFLHPEYIFSMSEGFY